MNSNLYNNTAVLPDTLLKHLDDCFNSVSADSSTEGYNRNKELRQSKTMTYQQLKRVKNWFDSYSGNKKDSPFILNGGDRMNAWCNEVLKIWRENQSTPKDAKQEIGMQNSHLKSHEKNSTNLNGSHSSTVDSLKVENFKIEIDKINNLIKKII
jgi:hypothetical protein